MNYTILPGDCLQVLRMFPNCYFDSIVTDPPYGLSFMGRKWDYDVPSVDVWVECLRVLKPGGHLLAFAGTRTQHRMAVRIEDAGFEIRDMIAWVYGSGFPKSHNGEWGGTALKPALEPITMARKPLIGTVEANWREHGTGALNIDGCRIGAGDDRATGGRPDKRGSQSIGGGWANDRERATGGRWPANLITDGSDEVVGLFPAQAGAAAPVHKRNGDKFRNSYGAFAGNVDEGGSTFHGDSGSAARFFQQCKGDYNEAWQDLNLPPENANTAAQSSSQQRQAAASALVLAVNSALPEGLYCSGLSLGPSTSATGSELKLIADSVTQTIQTIGQRFWLGSRPAKLSLSLNHASVAVSLEQTGTMTITASRWRSDGFAEDVTFNITPTSLEAGAKDCALSTAGKRLIYCAKASKKDRDDGLDHLPETEAADFDQRPSGDFAARMNRVRPPVLKRNTHPTVKPTDLMRHLCRLVTPPGGVVLDPFMGSGSTGKAAVQEGFRFIGIEREAEYVEIARARIAGATNA